MYEQAKAKTESRWQRKIFLCSENQIHELLKDIQGQHLQFLRTIKVTQNHEIISMSA